MTTDPNLHLKLLNYLNTAIVLVDYACHISFMNQSAEAIIGLSSSKAMGMDITKILSETESDREALTNAILDAHPFTKRQASFINVLNKRAIVDYSVTPIEIDNSTYLLVEIQKMDRLLKISREESILATHDTSRQLVRGLAHEVKNPLGGIRGAAQLLAAELDDPELTEYTDIITGETDRLRNLVDRMLGPNELPSISEVNVHQVLEHVSKLLAVETGSHITLSKDYDPSLPELSADIDQLIQAILNVARNALEALLESNTEKPEIRFKTRIRRRLTLGSVQHLLVARIDIEDNGPGVDKDIIDEIFYPMITGRSQGTGLGLAIAQSIINSHKGMIECESEAGKTLFSIYLPITNSTSPHPAHITQTGSNDSGESKS